MGEDVNGPPRWRDDPGLLEEMGLDLDAERASLKNHDMDALQSAVQTKIAAGVTASGASILPYLLGAILLVGLGIGVGTIDGTAERPLLVDPPIARHVDFAAKRIVRAPAGDAPQKSTPSVTKPALAPAPEPALQLRAQESNLAAQLDRYERGQTALTQSRPGDAIEAFEGYLRAYPSGRLVVEARLGLLHARFAKEHYAQAAEDAEGLIASKLAAHRRSEILRVLAESRAMLGECDAAAAAFDAAYTAKAVATRALARCKAMRVD